MISINPNPSEEDSGSCYKLNFGALIKQSNSHKRAVLDYLRKVHFKRILSRWLIYNSSFLLLILPLQQIWM